MTPLHDDEFDERFQITGSRPVQFLLSGFIRTGEPFTAHFADGRESFLTVLLAVRPEQNQLIVDCSGSQEQNRRLLACDHSIFVAKPEGIHVQFRCGQARETTHEGQRALALPLPDHVVRLQRRDAFRIETPRSRPARFIGRLPDGNRLELSLHDISIGGIGLNCPANPPDILSWGLVLPACRIILPDDPTPLVADLQVRQITPLEGRGNAVWRLGMRFENLARGDESRLQRYIAKIELERRELS